MTRLRFPAVELKFSDHELFECNRQKLSKLPIISIQDISSSFLKYETLIYINNNQTFQFVDQTFKSIISYNINFPLPFKWNLKLDKNKTEQ